MRFDGDIVISDPCYLYSSRNIQKNAPEFFPPLDCLDIYSLLETTWGGDCFGHVYRGRLPRKIGVLSSEKNPDFATPEQAIGEYGVDSARLGVFLMDDLLRVNPDYSPVTPDGIILACVIPDFHGNVEMVTRRLKYDDGGEDGIISIVGRGNLDFFTWEDMPSN